MFGKICLVLCVFFPWRFSNAGYAFRLGPGFSWGQSLSIFFVISVFFSGKQKPYFWNWCVPKGTTNHFFWHFGQFPRLFICTCLPLFVFICGFFCIVSFWESMFCSPAPAFYRTLVCGAKSHAFWKVVWSNCFFKTHGCFSISGNWPLGRFGKRKPLLFLALCKGLVWTADHPAAMGFRLFFWKASSFSSSSLPAS